MNNHMIFVFGSNLSGIHGAGAAKYAHKSLGAKWGCGEGLTGHCYALPTKGHNITQMNLTQIRKSVIKFANFAFQNHGASFQVTQVGCGLGGYTASDIAPMFKDYSELPHCNMFFDLEWKSELHKNAKFWGTF